MARSATLARRLRMNLEADAAPVWGNDENETADASPPDDETTSERNERLAALAAKHRASSAARIAAHPDN